MNPPGDPNHGALSLSPAGTDAPAPGVDGWLQRAVADLILGTTTDGVWLINAEARTTFVNHHIARLLGYSVEEMLGKPLFSFMDPEGKKITEGNLERRRAGVAEQHEFRCIRKDGAPIWVLVTANPVFDRAGKYAGSLAMIADLSVIKAREEKLLARVTELEWKASEVERDRDALTGLYSRRYFNDRFDQETLRGQRSRRLCVLFLGVDGMKGVNDKHGHLLGDDVLRRLGAALVGAPDAPERALLRASDIAARYRGDQMAVLAPGRDLQGGYELAERIVEHLRTVAVPAGNGRSIPVRASVGVAAFPLHGRTPEQLLGRADEALCRAKEQGGGRACLAEMD